MRLGAWIHSDSWHKSKQFRSGRCISDLEKSPLLEKWISRLVWLFCFASKGNPDCITNKRFVIQGGVTEISR